MTTVQATQGHTPSTLDDMQQPVTHLQACKAMVVQMVAKIHATYHANGDGSLKSQVDIYHEKAAAEQLHALVPRAIEAGINDFSYLNPLRERLSLCFNRVSLEMQKPASLRRNSYEYRSDKNAEQCDDNHYLEICEKTALSLKKIELAQATKAVAKDILPFKPRTEN